MEVGDGEDAKTLQRLPGKAGLAFLTSDVKWIDEHRLEYERGFAQDPCLRLVGFWRHLVGQAVAIGDEHPAVRQNGPSARSLGCSAVRE